MGGVAEWWGGAEGELMPAAGWERLSADWRPSDEDDGYILSLMKPEFKKGCFAPWIAAPKAGIDGKPGDFEYVRIAA